MIDKITSEISVKEYLPEYKDSVITLLGHLLKDLNERERTELFEWRYERNPYQKKQIMLLAFSENLLVGFRAYLIQYFCISGKQITVISPADTIIHPDYRRLGLISMLNKKSLDLIYSEYPENSVLLNSTTSKNAMPSYLKFDWYPCSHMNKVYGYRFSVNNTFKLLFKTKNKYQFNPLSFSKLKYTFELSNEIDTIRIIEFIQKYRDKTRFNNLRDEAFFIWRYSYEADKYISCICYLDGRMVGYTIIKRISNQQFSIEEFSAIDSKTLKIMFKSLQKKMNIPIMRTIIYSSRDKQAFKFCGFFVESDIFIKVFKKQRFPVLVRSTNPNLSESDFFIHGTDIRNIENWQLFQSDRH